jgi:predicted transcriptional regulator
LSEERTNLLEMTAEIVAAYVGNNTVRPAEVGEVVSVVHGALQNLTNPKPAEEPAPELKPAVPIKKSVTDDYIISLEDGRKFKSMKRYLGGLGMTPDQYRQKWGLPRDYPMVAPAYAAHRSELAKAAGLGARGPKVQVPAAEPAPVPEKAARGRGRPKKAA